MVLYDTDSGTTTGVALSDVASAVGLGDSRLQTLWLSNCLALHHCLPACNSACNVVPACGLWQSGDTAARHPSITWIPGPIFLTCCHNTHAEIRDAPKYWPLFFAPSLFEVCIFSAKHSFNVGTALSLL